MRSSTLRTESQDRPAIQFNSLLLPLLEPRRYKILTGGRGSGKSVGIADALIIQAMQARHRILCAREYQVSIRESVHKLLQERIVAMGLEDQFAVVQASIVCLRTGSEFIFKGLKHNVLEIKGLQGITRVWLEEAQAISNDSWEILIPTIRAPGSEIWVSFNPYLESDPTYQRMVVNQRPDAWVLRMNWEDNPWFPAELDTERRYLLETDPDAYEHVWGGECLKISEAVIFRDRMRVAEFDTPHDARFHYGADWGFANDPTCLVRCFMRDESLFIDHEAFGYGTEMDELPALFDRIPGARDWPIKADGARPETISYMANKFGFKITAAEKWPGSVEDGVARLKAFRSIVVHPRCPIIGKEFRMYSYKTDRITGDILPIIADAWNHGIDSCRYSLSDIIQNPRGPMKISPEALARSRMAPRMRVGMR